MLRRRSRATVLEPEALPAPPRPELPVSLLRRLEFKVVRRLDGFLFGDYRGLFFGPSLDLAEVREYQPGDEVRRIDWNVTARLNRLHVRQYREERELTAWLIVDMSPSMNFGTRRRLKRDLALEFAGTAALVVTRHGDKMAAIGLGGAEDAFVPPRTGRGQALRIVGTLNAVNGSARGDLAAALERLERTLRRRSLVFVVSDFLEPGPKPAWSGPMGRLAERHDVVAVRVSDPAERVLPDVGGLRMRDPETGRETWIDTSDKRVRSTHARLVAERDAAVEGSLRAARVDRLELSTETDLVPALLRFALRRRGRRP